MEIADLNREFEGMSADDIARTFVGTDDSGRILVGAYISTQRGFRLEDIEKRIKYYESLELPRNFFDD